MIHREPRNPIPAERPEYNYVEGVPDVPKVLDAAGLEREKYANTEFMQQRGLWDLLEVFSDGELRLVEQADLSNADKLLQSGSNRGEFYDKMTQLFADSKYKSGSEVDEVNKLARECGKIFAGYVLRGDLQPPMSTTTLPVVSPLDGRTMVQFDQYVWRSPYAAPPVIIEYGPGITGKKFLDAQLNAHDQDMPSFQYVGVSDGPFVNQFLNTYMGVSWSNRLSRQSVAKRAMLKRKIDSGEVFTGREDGMLQATKYMLATPQPGGSNEVSDLILLTGVHKADPKELESTIKLTPRLLRSYGRLMLASPMGRVENDSVPFQDQLRWAEQAGYVTEWQSTIRTGDARLGKATTSGVAVLHK